MISHSLLSDKRSVIDVLNSGDQRSRNTLMSLLTCRVTLISPSIRDCILESAAQWKLIRDQKLILVAIGAPSHS